MPSSGWLTIICCELARLEQKSASQQVIAARIHKLASGVIALTGASVVTVGGYLLFMHMSAASVAPANAIDATMQASAEIALVSPAASPDAVTKSASPGQQKSASVPGEAIAPSAAVPQPTAMPQPGAESVPTATSVGPASEPAASDARSLRARGVLAYRNGDLNGAIADLDQAINVDPKFSAAYIDRGIVLYRLRKFARAFADIEQAKRIQKASRSRSALLMARKPHNDPAGNTPSVAPALQQRAVAQDPSREEGVASVRLR